MEAWLTNDLLRRRPPVRGDDGRVAAEHKSDLRLHNTDASALKAPSAIPAVNLMYLQIMLLNNYSPKKQYRALVTTY
jgi:hypothetical protein